MVETIEHVGIVVTVTLGLIMVARYLLKGSLRTMKIYEAVEGDGVEPSLHQWRAEVREWRDEVRDLLAQNAEEHRVIGARLDEVQTELAHNGGTSIKDAVHRTERKLDDHLLSVDARQEAISTHLDELIRHLRRKPAEEEG